MKIQDTPMMSDKEIAIIDDLLQKLKPKHCLEWGAGGSTIYFPKKHKLNWLSIEHNGHYVSYISPKTTATVLWEPDNEWYIDCVKLGKKYDFILVDGLQRDSCIEVGLGMLNPNGILLLHDSGRKEYENVITKFKGKVLSNGEIPDGDYYTHRGLAVFK